MVDERCLNINIRPTIPESSAEGSGPHVVSERSQRRRVLKGVKLIFNGEFNAVDGIMKNVSETGAYIKIKSGFVVPDFIEIHNELEGYKVEAEVVRRYPGEMAVRFVGTPERIKQSRTQVLTMFSSVAEEQNPVEQEVRRKPNLIPQKPVFGKLNAR